MHYEAYSEPTDYWWWSDALYMVMPVMTKMYKLTGDTKYLDIPIFLAFCQFFEIVINAIPDEVFYKPNCAVDDRCINQQCDQEHSGCIDCHNNTSFLYFTKRPPCAKQTHSSLLYL